MVERSLAVLLGTRAVAQTLIEWLTAAHTRGDHVVLHWRWDDDVGSARRSSSLDDLRGRVAVCGPVHLVVSSALPTQHDAYVILDAADREAHEVDEHSDRHGGIASFRTALPSPLLGTATTATTGSIAAAATIRRSAGFAGIHLPPQRGLGADRHLCG
jgi:hypothetical protein